MNLVRPLFRLTVAIGVAATVLATTFAPASAFSPRVPQAPVLGGSLQGYLNSVGESINVNTDQVDAQVWSTSVSGNSTFTFMIEFAGNAGSNSIGVYNAGDAVPTLLTVFPPAATNGWYATAHFGGGNLIVSLFDNNSVFQGQNTYLGVTQNAFGFYISGPGGTYYSQDSRNPGSKPEILTYLGTGINFGDWWECFEDLAISGGGSDQDYDDAVLLLQSVAPTPTLGRTWGHLKSLYRQ